MKRTLLALAVLLVVVSAVSAAPPDHPSGRMVLLQDQVSQTLAKYRRAPDAQRRLELLSQVANLRDPRVAVALGEALSDPSDAVQMEAALGIVVHQVERPRMMPARAALEWARQWWTEHEDDLRKRARAVR